MQCWGEIAELRRRDIEAGCEVVHVERGVTRNEDGMRVDTTKTAKVRAVVVPPHIRSDIKHHLDAHTAKRDDALLFPNTTGNHLNDTQFRRRVSRPH